MKIEMGECIYCGQVRQFEVEDGISLSQEEKKPQGHRTMRLRGSEERSRSGEDPDNHPEKHYIPFSC